MQVTETLSSGLKREYKVVVAATELQKQLGDRLADMAKRANIKGFRPGKVPVPHLRRVYGKQAMAEVVDKVVQDQRNAIIADNKLKPAYQPEITFPTDQKEVEAVLDGKSDLAFSMALEVIPDFELKDHAGLELTRHVAEVSDAQINETLDRLSAQNKAFDEKSGAAETGDQVTIDFVGKIDGKAFDGGTANDVPLEIGSGQFIPGFEEQLIGAKAGDARVVKVSFPESYGVAELAGKPAEFDVKVSKVSGPKAGGPDDDFAKKLGFEGLDKLKERIREGTASEFGQMTAMKLKRDVLDALDKLYSFELPEKLVDAEFQSIWSALSNEMASAKKTFADENTTEEEARKEYRGIAERRVRLGLVLGTLGEKEGVNVNEQELQQALIGRMRQFPGQEKQVMEHYRKNPGALVELRGPIFEQKVVDLIVSKAKVTDKTVSRDELQAMVQDEEEGASVAHMQGQDEHDHDHDHDHEGHSHDHHEHDHHHADHKHNHDHAHASGGAQVSNPKPHKTSPSSNG